LEHVGEVDQESDNGRGNAEDSAAENDVHGQKVPTPFTQHVHLLGTAVALAGLAVFKTIEIAGKEAEAEGLTVGIATTTITDGSQERTGRRDEVRKNED
jgi:hypothetical protein